MTDGPYKIRNYHPNDFDKYLRLHVETEPVEPSGRFISTQALSDQLGRPNFTPQEDIFVAEFDGELVGDLSIILEPEIQRALLEGRVHPQHRRKGIATELFSRGLQRVRECGIKSAQVSVLETNDTARDFLSHLAFNFIRYFLEMQLDMQRVQLPRPEQGATSSRRLRSGEEVLLTALQNRCFAGTWGFHPNTTEEIAYRLNMHGRSPKDVILTYIEDKPVGYCWTIISSEENSKRDKNKGLIHMLGVDPEYRQQEIGKVILLSGLKVLKAKAVDKVELTVDSENPAAISLYESVGFEMYAKIGWYEKIVS